MIIQKIDPFQSIFVLIQVLLVFNYEVLFGAGIPITMPDGLSE